MSKLPALLLGVELWVNTGFWAPTADDHPQTVSRESVFDHPDPTAAEGRRLVYGTIFPAVVLRNVTCSKALSWVAHHMSSHNDAHLSVGMTLDGSKVFARKITLDLHHVSMPEVLNAIYQRLDGYWSVGSFSLLIKSREALARSKAIYQQIERSEWHSARTGANGIYNIH